MKTRPPECQPTYLQVAGHRIRIEPSTLYDPDGREVHLRPQTSHVLQVLAENPGELVATEELFSRVWPDRFVTSDSLVQCIREIRSALGESRRHLVTVNRRGYKLIASDDSSALNGESLVGDGPASITPTTNKSAQPQFVQTIDHVLSSDGTRLAYALAGSGPTVIQTPNWGTNIRIDWANSLFGPRIRELARHFRLARYDPRGLASSDRSARLGDVDDWSDDLAAVVEATDCAQYAVIGVSGGGLTAIRYAARQPAGLACLVLLAAFSHGALHGRRTPEHYEAFLRLIEDGWGKDNDAFRQLITGQLFPSATLEMMRSFNELQRTSCSGTVAARFMKAMALTDVDSDLQQIRVPTLVIHGLHDVPNPFAEAEAMANAIPNARLESFGGENHLPLPGSAEFDRVMGLIREFVRAHVQRADSAEGGFPD